MSRSTVLIATTDPLMAYALKARLGTECRHKGLRLEVCPGGEVSDGKDGIPPAYSCAENLFDELERRSVEDPLGLADTLVILDVGAQIEQAFSCHASRDDSWHLTAHHAGVAVELLLRFPQVFPVFLSPVVSLVKDGNFEEQGKDAEGNGVWHGFHRLKETLLTKNKSDTDPVSEQKVLSLIAPTNFVSPLDSHDCLFEIVERFANGMRCWFDPTALRTVVKNRFLGTLFGSKGDWSETTPQREVLLQRLDKVAVAVDEEREFTTLNGYTAWKYGRRAWLVTTYAEFRREKASWRREDTKEADGLILRDIDLRFPDIKPEEQEVRKKLMDIHQWGLDRCAIGVAATDSLEGQTTGCSTCDTGEAATGSGEVAFVPNCWVVRAVSGEKRVFFNWREYRPECDWRTGHDWNSGQKKSKRNEGLSYLGFQKPISTLYELKKCAGKGGWPAGTTVMAKLEAAPIDKSGESTASGHGAPYLNLAMSESLLRQARCCTRGGEESLVGALLASESYELLLGMSKTTALEALMEMHRAEVRAEVSFPGVANSLDIKERKSDISKTLDSLYKQHDHEHDFQSVKRRFLAQIWADLRAVYRDGERFEAAEQANIESLVQSQWSRHLGRLIRAEKLKCCCKTKLVNVATSFSSWMIASICTVVLATITYAMVPSLLSRSEISISTCGESCWSDGWELLISAALSTITLQPMTKVKEIMDCSGAWGQFWVVLHMGVAYVLFGLLISMLYRKVVRG